MMTLKFKFEREKELLEYIQLRMKKICAKHSNDFVNKNEFWFWRILNFDDIDFDVLTHSVDGEKKESFPSSEFLSFLDSLDEITADAFDFAKWCIDGLERWLKQMHTAVKKDEERILKELENSEGYLEYRAFKVEQKLENTTET